MAGDEALLLAAVAPTWTGSDRAASGRNAVEAGAKVLLMDDGLQNPSLSKTLSLLVVDGATGFGNGRVMPAGPLRERVESAASRCRAAVLIGPDLSGVLAQLPPTLTVLRASLEQGGEIAALVGHRVLAFAGIAKPNKFFLGLEQAGVELAACTPFPDHHVFSASELADLTANAKALNAVLVTTPKDATRLPADVTVHVVGVRLRWSIEAAVDALLDELIFGQTQLESTSHNRPMR
jgi:tetraacyldisaccharide 4'-kinase